MPTNPFTDVWHFLTATTNDCPTFMQCSSASPNGAPARSGLRGARKDRHRLEAALDATSHGINKA